MYEMWAELDPATQDPALLWHVLAKDAQQKALCGRQLERSLRAFPLPSDDPEQPPTDRYCHPCMQTVRQGMEAARSARRPRV